MTEEESTMAVEAMTAIPFFPSAPAAQSLIGDELRSMCSTADQAMWLVRRISQVFKKWEGLAEMRAVFCNKYKPTDGIEAVSSIYPDGIPSEKESRPMLESAPMKALPAGASASVDPEAERTVIELATARAMPPVKRFRTISDDEARVDAELRQIFHLGSGK